MKSLTDPKTHTWTPEQKALAQKTLGIDGTGGSGGTGGSTVGEWIEATKISDTYYTLTLNEPGVYEYYIYLLIPAGNPARLYSSILVFNPDDTKSVAPYEATIISDNTTNLGIMVETDPDFGSYGTLSLRTTETEFISYEEIFKARKIRDI
jgi:hypothetical protein